MDSKHWRKVGSDDSFLRRNAAMTEVVRTAMPTCYSRSTVDVHGKPNHVRPNEIWQHRHEALGMFAFQWVVWNASATALTDVVGLVRHVPGKGVQLASAEILRRGDTRLAFEWAVRDAQGCELIDFSSHFWRRQIEVVEPGPDPWADFDAALTPDALENKYGLLRDTASAAVPAKYFERTDASATAQAAGKSHLIEVRPHRLTELALFALIWRALDPGTKRPLRLVGLARYETDAQGVQLVTVRPVTGPGLPRRATADGGRAEEAPATQFGFEWATEVLGSTAPIDLSTRFWSDVPQLADERKPTEQASAEKREDTPNKAQQAVAKIDQFIREYLRPGSISDGLESADTDKALEAQLIPAAGDQDWREGEANDQQTLKDALQQFGTLNFSYDPTDRRIILLVRQVLFYKNCCLYRLIDRRGVRTRYCSFVVHRRGGKYAICSLSIAAAAIHDFNKKMMDYKDLNIAAATAASYLKFFCEYVHGERGAFLVLESVNDLRWLDKWDEARNRLAIEPVRTWRVPTQLPPSEPAVLPPAGDEMAEEQTSPTPASIAVCRAFIGYGRTVFAAAMLVKTDGSVEILDDELMHDGDLPVEPISFDEEFQFELVAPRHRELS